ncbi:YmfQ family protein [Paraburkholderia aromaticivorans]|uniref:Phage tail protein n=1 Tax=Paraburkholderia aromaticivorans TaxID=2026199 RepID=A0A248VP28_9BURK|nr:putative phage tail protein [Paraburkholderia aromaticivorans]ASW00130.1 phage tail protein [Paraburkholderia aromaticivorans]
MAAPNYQASDFLKAIQALMPRGLAWPRDPTSVMAQAMSGLSPTWARHTARNNNLLVDAFPKTAVELLPEWESALGLPDPCAGPAPTVAQRQAQVVARFAGSGGQSVPYFIQYAALLGYTVTVTEYVSARVGQSRVGQPVFRLGPQWSFVWQINAPLNTITQSKVGTARAGDPLASWGNAVLQCELNEVIPAHTILIFAYT